MKKLHIFLSLLLTLLASSCTKKSTVEFLPFQSEEDGRWGLISPKGEVLFTEEFEREPTVARNGRFMVRDKDGNFHRECDLTPKAFYEKYIRRYVLYGVLRLFRTIVPI